MAGPVPYQGGWHPTNDYVAELGQARAQALVQGRIDSGKYDIHPVTGCWIATTSLNNSGYAVHKRYSNAALAQQEATGARPPRNSGVNFLLHRAAYLAHHGRDISVGNVSSHLCPFKACFRHDHIADEPQAANLARQGCVGVIRCLEHLTAIVDLCRHDPKCITLPPTNVRCCLSNNPSPPSSSLPAEPAPAHVSSRAESQALLEQESQIDPDGLQGARALGLERELGVAADVDGSPASSLSPPPPAAALRPGSSQSASDVPLPPRQRRRLNPPSQEATPSGAQSPINTSDFVVPDDTQFIEYEETDTGEGD